MDVNSVFPTHLHSSGSTQLVPTSGVHHRLELIAVLAHSAAALLCHEPWSKNRRGRAGLLTEKDSTWGRQSGKLLRLWDLATGWFPGDC